MTVTHATLVRAGAYWLIGQGYAACALEMACPLLEQPDVIGWGTRESALIECKTSRADFRADAKKVHRNHEGVGQLRWYLVTEGLVKPEEVPEGWGLLEYRRREYGGRGYYIRQLKRPERRLPTEGMLLNERAILTSMVRRSLKALELVRPLVAGDGVEEAPR